MTYTLTWEERTVDGCECVHVVGLIWYAVCALEEQGAEKSAQPEGATVSYR